jgi:PAS domain S-box-containing protein
MSSLNPRSAEIEEQERLSAIPDGLSQVSERGFREIIDALPAAIYTTDAKGRLTHFNPACVELSGRTPEIGSDHWCVTWKLYHPDGTPMPHDECPMAIALKEGRIVRGAEAIAERPDGTRIWFQPYPMPLRDAEGRVIGGLNMLVDITERKQAEARIQSDADALSRLNELSSRLWTLRSLREGLDEMLTATIDLLGADFGNIQILDTQRNVLLIEAQRGFQDEFLNFFREVSAEDGSCCGRALRSGERILVEDVETDPDFAPMLHVVRAAGYRAVQSTPLMGRDGRPLGMISTHFRAVHRPSKQDLRLLDLYARQASDFIERCRTDAQREAELTDTKLLADVSAEIVREDDVQVIYEKIMDAAVGIMRSDFASIQMLYPERYAPGSGGELRLLASRGFTPQAAKFLEWVCAESKCTRAIALATGKRCIDADIANSQFLADTADQEAYLQAGIGACQSTPLISRTGKLVGVISTYWNKPHQPPERNLRLLDLLARQAADLIDRKKAEESLRESEGRSRQLANLLPVAVYTCDASGLITYYNPKAAELWGRAPKPGDSDERFCGSEQMVLDNGQVLPHDQCPMAVALHDGSSFRQASVNVRRPDGSMISVRVNIDPIKDAGGRIVGAINVFSDVTDLRRAEQALRESEHRFRSIFETVGVSLWQEDFSEVKGALDRLKEQGVSDFRTYFAEHPEFVRQAIGMVKLDDVNAASLRLFGASEKEQLLESLDRIFQPETEAVFVEKMLAIVEGRRRFESEAALRTLSGRRIDVFMTMTLPEAGERFDRVLVSLMDITERKQAELLLKSEKRALEMAAEGASLREVLEFLIGMVEAQSDGCLVASLALLNENQTHFSDSIAPKLPASYHQAVKGMAVASDTGSCCRAVLTGRPVIVPDVAADPQWSRFAAFLVPLGYRAAWSTLVKGSDGRVLGTFAIYYTQHPQEPKPSDQQFVEGITQTAALVIERARAEGLLREREELFHMLADNMAQLAWTCDQLGNITWYNQRWLDYTGLSFEEMKGWDWSKVQHPDHLERVVARVKRSVAAGEPWEDLFPLRRRDGQYRWFLSSAVPIRNEQGEIVRWFGTNTDVTEHRAAEEALRENDRRKDEFLAMLAHELRNPLAPIRNAAQLLKLTGSPDANQQWAFEVIERQTQHLTRLVDDLLDVSRITQGNITLQREPLVLSMIINRAVEASRPLVDARRHQLTVTLPPEPVRVEGDLTRLVQVISNLVNNAAKYTEESGCIRIEAAVEGGEAVVRVRDNGIGMPADLLPHVFDLFTQADRSFNRTQGGLGIGLTLVRRLVEMHGGRVEAQSEGPGRGSEFILRLPLAQVEASASVARRTELSTPNTGHRTPLRVLVVDDNVDSAEMMGFLLKLDGHETRLAYDGAAALTAARAFQPQVILCDIGLPGMDGYEVARQLRAQPAFKHARLIALSGYGQYKDRRRAKEAGFDYHLTKPVEPDSLTALLDSVSPDVLAINNGQEE